MVDHERYQKRANRDDPVGLNLAEADELFRRLAALSPRKVRRLLRRGVAGRELLELLRADAAPRSHRLGGPLS